MKKYRTWNGEMSEELTPATVEFWFGSDWESVLGALEPDAFGVVSRVNGGSEQNGFDILLEED